MFASSWKGSMLSALAVGISLGMSQYLHAAEWKSGVPRTAYATLFEWSWDSVAKECKNVLGPKGYAAVQVSPPQQHIGGAQWWTRYQPTGYQIESRSGNREQFRNMVAACKAAGVDVYVDTVINHMAATGRDFPSVPFGGNDFNNPKCTIQDGDYGSPGNRNAVTQCDLSGLSDLNTSSGYVQDKIAGYLNDLRSLGVAGFRIDAAKHIRPNELGAIKAKVPGDYFFTQEVIRDGNVGNDMGGYLAIGTVNEFNFTYAMKNAFLNMGGWNLSRLPEAFNSWGFMPGDKATVFVHNHDTERKLCNGYGMGSSCDSLNTFSGDKLYLAQIFMLAYNYGYPTVASGYYFNNHDMGPQGQPYEGGESTPANCRNNFEVGKWDCIHRDRRVANMVGFRNYTAAASLDGWQAEGTDRISFRRGNKGFVAINNNGGHWQRTFQTGLPDGKYCNVTASDNPETGNCPADTQITVVGGNATVSVAPNSAVALHVGARVGEGSGGGDGGDGGDGGGECTAAFCPSLTPVDSNPGKAAIAAGKSVTLYYKGRLAGSGSMKLHWGTNGWTGVQQTTMTKGADGYWAGTITIPAAATSLEFVFTDGSAWDNNGGADWKWPVSGGSDGGDNDGDTGAAVTVTFKVNAQTQMGESVYITGDQTELGQWSSSPDSGRKCDAASYPVWTCKITFVNGGKAVKYKYVKLGLGTKWEGGSDRSYTLPAGAATKDDGSFR